MKKRIFTFWEPCKNIPAYIDLCMHTWQKFLPDYEIVVLDYSNLKNWIDDECYKSILYKKFSLPKQADAIRCAVLRRHGGLWLDADTIITSDKVNELLKIPSDFVLIERHIAFIYAQPESKILALWENEIRERVQIYKKWHLLAQLFNRKYYKKLKSWDYMGNGIIDKYLEIAGEKHFYSIDDQTVNAFPEKTYYKPVQESELIYNYRNFWFNNDFSQYILEHKSFDIICLHNSWTPKKFKQLKQEDVFKQDCTMSKLLQKILQERELWI